MDKTKARITSQGDSIHAMLSSGEMFIGTLDEIAALLRSRTITAADITMPHNDDNDSPSTGQASLSTTPCMPTTLTKSSRYASATASLDTD